MSCCTTWSRDKDPILHDFYEERLLVPGWIAAVEEHEAHYIADCLTHSLALRRRWKTSEILGRRWRKVPPGAVHRLVEAWAEPDRPSGEDGGVMVMQLSPADVSALAHTIQAPQNREVALQSGDREKK